MTGLYCFPPARDPAPRRGPPAWLCEECRDVRPAELARVSGADVYPGRRDLADKPIWRCPCGAFVGCHPGTTKALGTTAGQVLRSLRRRAHAAFDPAWTSGAVTRGRCYGWLISVLHVTPAAAHIGLLDAEQCRALINACFCWGGPR